MLRFPFIPPNTKISVHTIFTFLFVGVLIVLLVGATGCANIIPPTGGPRDSLPPVLIAETPMDSATNVTTRRFTFVFDEYVELQDAMQNVLVSPTPVLPPSIDYKLRTVTVRLRDSLEPNTTYSINFGNAIKDINEGNVFKNFSYVFSTGSRIDNYTLSGKVVEAQTGKVDSTLVVILHKNLDDSAVSKERPRYIARLDGQGNFTFRNLPGGTFALYAVPDGFSRRFDETRLFAFADKPILIGDSSTPVTLFAYIENPRPATIATTKPNREQRPLRITTNLEAKSLDFLQPLVLSLDRRISKLDSTKISLTNNLFAPITNYSTSIDTSFTKVNIRHSWMPNTEYNAIVLKDAVTDSAGSTLARTDTINFTTKREEEYGSVKIRFNNLDVTKNPVLIIVQNEQIIQSIPLTQRDWIQKFFKPGEFDLRILYDANKNGRWDAGSFMGTRRQPERVITLSTKLNVRTNWDNEIEINLTP